MLMFNFNNAFSLPKGFVVRVDFSYQTKGASQNYILNQTGEIDLSLRKSFLQDRLSFNLQWFDVGHLSRQNIVVSILHIKDINLIVSLSG